MMLKSRYVVPVEGPVLTDGAVVVKAGRVAAVGPADTLNDDAVVDHGDAVICPGFVNAHTHLELNLLAGRVAPSEDFTDWLRRLLAESGKFLGDSGRVQEAVRLGVRQSLTAGVTTIGDITRFPHWTREVLAGSVLQGVSFGEVIAIGAGRGMLTERLAAATSEEWQTPRLRIGVSPHSPYTVEPDALRACASWAARATAPLCIHLAETRAEERFTRYRDGRFADFLQELGIWDDEIPVSGCRPVELASASGVLGSQTVIAHANYVTDSDIAAIAESGASVAYCPRTHHAFGHPPHRFREMLAAGVNVCIGTDSLASNPSLSVLDEMRFLKQNHGDLSADEIIAMGTLRGARALGFGNQTGSITVGKSADLAVIPLEDPPAAGGWEGILSASTNPLQVYLAGVPQLGLREQSTS